MRSLEAEEELLIVEETDEAEIDPTRVEHELREGQRDGCNEREEGEGENQEDGGPDEEPSRRAVRAPGADRLGRPLSGSPPRSRTRQARLSRRLVDRAIS